MDEQRSLINIVSSTNTWPKDQSNFKSHSLVIPSITVKSGQQNAYHDNAWKERIPPLIKHEVVSQSSSQVSSDLPSRNMDDQPLDLTCTRKRKPCHSDNPDAPLDLSVKKPRHVIQQEPDQLPINFTKLQELDSTSVPTNISADDSISAFQNVSTLPPSGNVDNPILVDDTPVTETITSWKFPASKLIQFAHLHNSAITQLTPRHLPMNYSPFVSSEQSFPGNVHVNLGGVQRSTSLFGFFPPPDKPKTEVSSSLLLQSGSTVQSDKFYSNLDNCSQTPYFVPSNVIQSKRMDTKHLKFHEIGSNLRKLLKKDEGVDQTRCSEIINFDQCRPQTKSNNNSTIVRNLQIIVPPNYSKSGVAHFEDSKITPVTPFSDRSEMKGFLSTPHPSSTLSYAAGMENTFQNESSSNRTSCKVLGHRSSKKIPVANVQPFMKPGILDANEPIVIDPSPPPPPFNVATQTPAINSADSFPPQMTKPPSEQTWCPVVSHPQKLLIQDLSDDHPTRSIDLENLDFMMNESFVSEPSNSTIGEECSPSNQTPSPNSCTTKSINKESRGKKCEIQSKKKTSTAIEYIDDDTVSHEDSSSPSEEHHMSAQKRNYVRKSQKHQAESVPSTPPSTSSSTPPSDDSQKLSRVSNKRKYQRRKLDEYQVQGSTSHASMQPEISASSNQQQTDDELIQTRDLTSHHQTFHHDEQNIEETYAASNSSFNKSNEVFKPHLTFIQGNELQRDFTQPMGMSEPPYSMFRVTDRRGRGGKRRNSKKESEGMPRSGQPTFYGFFTSPLRSSNRGRCKKNPSSINTSRTISSTPITSSSSAETSGNSCGAEKNLAETRLHQATRLGCEDLVWHFLSVESIHANVQDNNGTTPLHICSSSGNTGIARLLLSYGAQPNAKALDGSRPLHNAVLGNHLNLAKLLLAFGADPMLTNFDEKTPVQLCRSKKMKNFLKGFLNDVTGNGEVLWGFTGDLYDDCCDFLSNLPGDDDDVDIHFDVFSSNPPPPVYQVRQEGETKLQACHLLTDVCKTLGTTQKFCSKKLNIVEGSKVIWGQQQQQDTKEASQSDSPAKYVAIDNHLKKLMKTESFKIGRWNEQASKVSEDKKKSTKKQNVVESLSKLARICKNTSSSMVDGGRKSSQEEKNGGGGGGTMKNFDSNNSEPLPVLDKHEKEISTGGRKTKSEDMEMPQLTLYS